MADGGAGTPGFPAIERGPDVVGVARGHAKAGDVDKQLLHDLVHGR